VTGATREPSVLAGVPHIMVSLLGGAGLGLGAGLGEGTTGEGEGTGLGDTEGEGEGDGGGGDGDGDSAALGMLHFPEGSAPPCSKVPPGQL